MNTVYAAVLQNETEIILLWETSDIEYYVDVLGYEVIERVDYETC